MCNGSETLTRHRDLLLRNRYFSRRYGLYCGGMLNDGVCPLCFHSNEDVKLKQTLFRRRLIGICSGVDEPVSGMAGDFDCPCRGWFHQDGGSEHVGSVRERRTLFRIAGWPNMSLTKSDRCSFAGLLLPLRTSSASCRCRFTARKVMLFSTKKRIRSKSDDEHPGLALGCRGPACGAE